MGVCLHRIHTQHLNCRVHNTHLALIIAAATDNTPGKGKRRRKTPSVCINNIFERGIVT